jgi:hypothetical protein
VSLDEWGEYVVYDKDEIRVIRSYRVYSEKGELVSTGREEETIPVREGMDVEEELRKARKDSTRRSRGREEK